MVQGDEPGRCRVTTREEQGRHELVRDKHGWGRGEERRGEEPEQEGATGAGKAAQEKWPPTAAAAWAEKP